MISKLYLLIKINMNIIKINKIKILKLIRIKIRIDRLILKIKKWKCLLYLVCV